MIDEYEDLKNRFIHHQPDEARALEHARIRAACLELALLIRQMAPHSRETSLAMTKIEEAMFWANAALARSGGDGRI